MHVRGLRYRLSPQVSGTASVSEDVCGFARFFVDVAHISVKHEELTLQCFLRCSEAASQRHVPHAQGGSSLVNAQIRAV